MNNSGDVFYCYECRKTSDILMQGLHCPYCGHRLFYNYEELIKYLEEEEVTAKEPFSKPRRFKKHQE